MIERMQLLRTIYNEDSTAGILLVNDCKYCYTLEDKVRPAGIKIPYQTAIEAGIYRVSVTYSNHFKRDMPHIEGVSGFVGIRIHGGNTAKDTSGCILVARYRIGKNKI